MFKKPFYIKYESTIENIVQFKIVNKKKLEKNWNKFRDLLSDTSFGGMGEIFAYIENEKLLKKEFGIVIKRKIKSKKPTSYNVKKAYDHYGILAIASYTTTTKPKRKDHN